MDILTSLTMTNLLMLFLPVVISTLKFSQMDFPMYVTKIVKFSFILSLIPMTMFFYYNYDYSVFNWHWMSTQSMNLIMSFKMDLYSMLFMPIALFVTWSITEFSLWYMHSDPNLNRFIKFLLLFLITMMILVTANNLFQLFIGWEGVGIMSFLLIGWWYGRSDANSAALQAILYNRIGDIGLILSISWFALKYNSMDLQTILNIKHDKNILPLMGLLLAAMGKSAQFGLHPWLPSAMEGPTPVSALLHSSTMVVAGIFLLIRFFPIMDNYMMKSLMLLIGAMTTLFTALCAITQNDIKKIIAFSTSSQLGLMMVTLGIGSPYLAFFHICTHAFFKATLFLCSGSIIHSLNDEQDIRKMGGLAKAMPLTSSFLTIGSLALTGTPFLTGFYSKDLIIESLNSSYANAWALLITLIATSLTAVYSARIVFFVFSNFPRMSSTANINEDNISLINPIKRLITGSIFAGFLLSNLIPPIITPPMTMPMTLKTSALMVTMLGLILAFELNNLTLNLTTNYPSHFMKFSSLLGYFPNLFHRLFPNINLIISQKYAYKTLDSTLLEFMLPKTLASINILASTTTSNQKGLIKLYFLSILLTLPLPILLFLI